MPKSKRDRKVTLTKTAKKGGLEFKQGLIQRIDELTIENHQNIVQDEIPDITNDQMIGVFKRTQKELV